MIAALISAAHAVWAAVNRDLKLANSAASSACPAAESGSSVACARSAASSERSLAKAVLMSWIAAVQAGLKASAIVCVSLAAGTVSTATVPAEAP